MVQATTRKYKQLTHQFHFISHNQHVFIQRHLGLGPPPPPLPPPLKAPSVQPSYYTAPIEVSSMQNDRNGSSNAADNDNDSDEIDSDFGLEVVEEPTLRPSELVRGNHNRTMSTISGNLVSM